MFVQRAVRIYFLSYSFALSQLNKGKKDSMELMANHANRTAPLPLSLKLFHLKILSYKYRFDQKIIRIWCYQKNYCRPENMLVLLTTLGESSRFLGEWTDLYNRRKHHQPVMVTYFPWLTFEIFWLSIFIMSSKIIRLIWFSNNEFLIFKI